MRYTLCVRDCPVCETVRRAGRSSGGLSISFISGGTPQICQRLIYMPLLTANRFYQRADAQRVKCSPGMDASSASSTASMAAPPGACSRSLY